MEEETRINTGLGFSHEPIPESISNTLLENFNTNDHSPENKLKLKEFLEEEIGV